MTSSMLPNFPQDTPNQGAHLQGTRQGPHHSRTTRHDTSSNLRGNEGAHERATRRGNVELKEEAATFSDALDAARNSQPQPDDLTPKAEMPLTAGTTLALTDSATAQALAANATLLTAGDATLVTTGDEGLTALTSLDGAAEGVEGARVTLRGEDSTGEAVRGQHRNFRQTSGRDESIREDTDRRRMIRHANAGIQNLRGIRRTPHPELAMKALRAAAEKTPAQADLSLVGELAGVRLKGDGTSKLMPAPQLAVNTNSEQVGTQAAEAGAAHRVRAAAAQQPSLNAEARTEAGVETERAALLDEGDATADFDTAMDNAQTSRLDVTESRAATRAEGSAREATGPSAANQVAEAAKKMAADGRRVLEIELKPEGMGPVRLKLVDRGPGAEHGGLRMEIMALRGETREMLHRHMDQLRETLGGWDVKLHGARTEQTTVQTSQTREDSSGSPYQQQGRQDGQSRREDTHAQEEFEQFFQSEQA